MRKALFFLALLFASCGVSKKIGRSAKEDVLRADALKTAHVGISVYEPATGKTWYDYQGANYFVPASNTKIPTCYAAMKYLGDSLVGLRYQKKSDSLYYIGPSGDPTFLHPDFPLQPVFSFLEKSCCYKPYQYADLFFEWESIWREKGLGAGWSWSDYMQPYMAERSPFPVYGNVLKLKSVSPPESPNRAAGLASLPEDYPFGPLGESDGAVENNRFEIEREFDNNRFFVYPSEKKFDSVILTLTNLARFYEFKMILARAMSKDDNHRIANRLHSERDTSLNFKGKWKIIRSRPTDSLLRPMMHRSDNFFAEQSLLMVSNELLGFMNDEKIIDTLLKTDFNDLPQKPRWVDGSGLSRYNLFTPQDFVFILSKMKNEFGTARLKNIFATGGEGTLSNYYKTDSGFLYAKTGSLSGVVALSGFLVTKKGKDLIFSVQVNNHNGSATEVRRAVETFVHGLRERY